MWEGGNGCEWVKNMYICQLLHVYSLPCLRCSHFTCAGSVGSVVLAIGLAKLPVMPSLCSSA